MGAELVHYTVSDAIAQITLDRAPRRAIENAAESFALVATTQDCREGLDAFVEKRSPKYTGR